MKPTSAEPSRISTNREKLHAGRGAVGKTTVVGLARARAAWRTSRRRSRSSSPDATHAARRDPQARTKPARRVHTDESPAYSGLGGLFFPATTPSITASGQVRARRRPRQFSIESVWAVLKRGSPGRLPPRSVTKHLGRYVNEFAFRLNDGDVKRHTLDRLDSMIALTIGKRLTFAGLTA